MKKLYTKALALAAFCMSAFAVNAAEHTDSRLVLEDRSGWTVTGCSQCNSQAEAGKDGGLNHIIDDDINTFWHTSWTGVADQTSYGHYIIFDRGEAAKEIVAFSYTPRQNSTGNGFVTKYSLFAVDEVPEIPVCEGNWSCADPDHLAAIEWTAGNIPLISDGTFNIVYSDLNTHGEHVVELPSPTSARYIVFVIDDCSSANEGMFANCAEFKTYYKEDFVWNDPQDLLLGKQFKLFNAGREQYMGVNTFEVNVGTTEEPSMVNKLQADVATSDPLNAIWSIVEGENGKFKLYNDRTNTYLAPITASTGFNARLDMVTSAEEAGNYAIEWMDANKCELLAFTSDLGDDQYASYNALHMAGFGGIVRWSAGDLPSQFSVTLMDDEEFGSLAEEHIALYPYGAVGYPEATEAHAQAAEELRANPSDFTKYDAYTEAAAANTNAVIRPEAGKYYTITAATDDYKGGQIVEPYASDIIEVLDTPAGKVSAMWQFNSCAEPAADLYTINAANTGKALSDLTFGTPATIVEPANAGKYDLFNENHKGYGGVSLITYYNEERADYKVARAHLYDGKIGIDTYKVGTLGWRIVEVKEVPVSFTDGYASFHFPFAVNVPEGVKVYTLAKVEDSKAVVEALEGDIIPANTPVIVASKAETVNFPIAVANEVAAQSEEAEEGEGEEEPAAEAVLKGTNAPVTVEKAYVLSGSTFVPVEGNAIPENTAYIVSDGDGEIALHIPAIAIELNETEVTIEVEETATLVATVLPEENTEKATVVWTSSNEAVATVSAEGVVTAVAAGEATITASYGELEAHCTVTVTDIESLIDEIRANAAAFELYDLAGRRINAAPAHGVYLLNRGGRAQKITL